MKRTTIKKLPLYTDATIAEMVKVLHNAGGKPVAKKTLVAICTKNKVKWPESRLYWMRRIMRDHASRAVTYDRITRSYTLKGPGSAKPNAKLRQRKVGADKGVALQEFAKGRKVTATKPVAQKEAATAA